MKKELIIIMIIFSFLISSFNVFAMNINLDNSIEIKSEKYNFTFSEASIETKDKYISVDLKEATTSLMIPGKPVLPVYSKTYIFPFGTIIKNVKIINSNIFEKEIKAKIQPAPNPIIKSDKIDNNKVIIQEDEIYKSEELYPNNWYTYKTNCGRNGDDLVTFLTIHIYPVRYSPTKNILLNLDDIEISVSYKESDKIINSDSEYDMVVIGPRIFKNSIKPLIEHKNNHGVSTFFKSTESICKPQIFGGYKGRDDAEKVKYFIKNAIEDYGIKYVLFIGGMKGQFFRWYVPVRYSHLDDLSWLQNFTELTYLTDLYFADIYKEGGEFDDWDSNGNGIFAEMKWRLNFINTSIDLKRVDILDLVPDVYLGRIPCRTIKEVKIIVNKIIEYENNAYSKNWFDNMIIVAGDSFPSTNNDTEVEYSDYEGEMCTNLSSSFLKSIGFNITKIWASIGTLNNSTDIINAINNGAGFLHFDGHGNPMVWSTHKPNSEEWIEQFYISDMANLENKEKLPVCVVGGCHNSQFDVSLLNIIRHPFKLKYGIFSPRTWSYNLIRQENGGSIATIGNTGLGYGAVGDYNNNTIPDCIEFFSGKIEVDFFKIYSQNTNNSLGEIHSQAITEYINLFIPNYSWNKKQYSETVIDIKTVQQWALFGDPSLKIGGYKPN